MAELDTGAIVGIAIACAVGGIALLVLIADMFHVFWYVRYYHVPKADPVKVANYRKRMEDAYYHRDTEGDSSLNPFAHVVTDEEFEANLVAFEEEMGKKGVDPNNSMFASFDDPYTRLLRESLMVVIAPRAVLFQVAHPYVAVGIKQHSNIVRDTPKRFQKTYFHMFRLSFGTRREALASARSLRRTHNRVFGKFTTKANDFMPEGHFYTANQTHALLYVGLALAESVLFGYIALVGNFSPEEREQLARDASFGLMLFGVPKSLATGTYEEFRIAIEACWQSDILTFCDEAKEISKHLLYPTVWYLKPIFLVARYLTRVIMPEKFQKQIFGKKSNVVDQVVVSVVGGVARFVYRFFPRAGRYVPEYSMARRRNGLSTAPCMLLDPCYIVIERVFNKAKDFFMGCLLPQVNEEVAERRISESPELVLSELQKKPDVYPPAKPSARNNNGDAVAAYLQ
ncbi:hypothetical protein BASA81_000282 [Batrachochytrium salamandrivorans]|nr:hypothetical protein BASA81_000282 [Batrachochytrium salamandrivorans]